MITINEALSIVLNQNVKRSVVEIYIEDALHFVLAEDIVAPISLPSFPQSAMDGYAIKGFEKECKLVGEIQAGISSNPTMEEGTAIRIFTGGAVPSNATAVIMQEKVTISKKDIVINDEIIEGKNIRQIGEQIQKDTQVFIKGQEVNSSVIGLLASFGIEKIKVFEQPTISLVSTGNELQSLGNALEYGQIYESNSITLKNVAKEYNYKISSFSKVEDNYINTKTTLLKELQKSDILLITGGISVGDYDYVGKALEDIGVKQLFYKVSQKPGKPLYFGILNEKYVFALPGNPAAALTCFYIYVLPLLDKWTNRSQIGLKKIYLPISESYFNKTNRTLLLKSKIIDNKVHILEGQASSMIYAFSKADSIAIIGENVNQINNEEHIELYLL